MKQTQSADSINPNLEVETILPQSNIINRLKLVLFLFLSN